MDFANHPLNRTQYSNSDSKQEGSTNSHSNSTVSTSQVLSSVTDLIPNPDYAPWYAKQLRKLGTARFMVLANKARAGSDTPAALFKWMLNNSTIVK